MRKKFKFIYTITFLLVLMTFLMTLSFNVGNKTTATEERKIEDIVGATTAGGFYEFDPMVSCLEDGANRVYDMGSRVVKLWLTSSSAGSSYAYNVDWEKYNITNCVDLLNSTPYRNVLSKDFSTIIFETQTFNLDEDIKEVVWNDGMSDAEKERLTSEMYQVAKYLLREYNGTKKTFVLQNWEGDNMLGSNHIRMSESGYYYDVRLNSAQEAGPSTDQVIKTKIKGLIDWFNARQAGIDKAVKEAGKFTDVTVLGALEINFIYLEGIDSPPYPYPDSPILLNSVIPYTDCDIYSYSNWQSAYMQKVDSLNERLTKYHEGIGSTYIDQNGDTKERRPMHREGQKTKVMLGEYGSAELFQPNGSAFQENYSEMTDLYQYSVIRTQTEIALNFGCEYIMMWQLYCNELQGIEEINKAIGEEAGSPTQLRGYWLIRPDGTFTSSYRYFESLYNPSKLIYKGEANGNISIDREGNQIVVKGIRVGDSHPHNDNTIYSNDIELLGSSDGVEYSLIQYFAYDTVVSEHNGLYEYEVNFVSMEDISSYRYFKVEKKEENLQLEYMEIYPKIRDGLLKIKVSGNRNGEGKKYFQAYTLSSGETLKLEPEFNMAFTGQVTYKSDNRYIAEVDEDGLVLGKVNGVTNILVTVSGGNLKKEYTTSIVVTVMALGDEILHDSFIGYHTISYENDDVKKVGTELAGFGSVVFENGVQPKYFDQFNMHFYRLDVEEKRTELAFFKTIYGNTSIGYILDWNNYGYCTLTYKTDEDIGGYAIDLNTYGLNALQSIQIFLSSDNENWIQVSSSLNDSYSIGLDYFYNKVVNRQILPSGMRFLKIRLAYVDSNRWNPQMYDVKIYGEPSIAFPEYVDSVNPTISINGDIEESVVLGPSIEIPNAVVSDNYTTEEELLENYSVKAYYYMDGSFFEIDTKDNKVNLTVEAIYKIEYSVYDLAGNMAVKNLYVQAIRAKDEPKKGCRSNLGIGNFVIFGLLSLLGLATYLRKKYSFRNY